MEIFISAEGIDRILYYEVKNNISYEINMLLHNKVSNIIVPREQVINGKVRLSFIINKCTDFSSKVSIVKPGIRQVNALLKSIVNTCEECSKYMLSPSRIILEPEYMYVDNKDENYFIYASGEELDFEEEFKKLLEYLMKVINYEDEDCVTLVYGLYQVLMEEGLCAQQLIDYYNTKSKALNNDNIVNDNSTSEKHYQIDSLSKERALDILFEEVEDNSKRGFDSGKSKCDASKNGYNSSKTKCDTSGNGSYISKGKDNDSVKTYNGSKVSSNNNNVLLIVVIAGAVATISWTIFAIIKGITSFNIKVLLIILIITVISTIIYIKRKFDNQEEANVEIQSQTLQQRVGKRITKNSSNAAVYMLSALTEDTPNIELRDGENVVGRLGQNVDVGIESTDVSRKHAIIDVDNDAIYVEDLNSTNGTFINKKKILSNKKTVLNTGDIVTFATTEYFIKK